MLRWDKRTSESFGCKHTKSDSKESSEDVKVSGTTLTIRVNSEVFLGSAIVKVMDINQKEHEARVLIDSCSQTHFITQNLVDKLQLTKRTLNCTFSGLGHTSTKAQYFVKTKIRSKKSQFESEETCIALPTITGILTSSQIPKNISLADSNFNKPAGRSNLVIKILCCKKHC